MQPSANCVTVHLVYRVTVCIQPFNQEILPSHELFYKLAYFYCSLISIFILLILN